MDEDARAVARIVAANTGGKQPETIDKPHLRMLACRNADLTPTQFKKALATALENGLLEQPSNNEYRALMGYFELKNGSTPSESG